jgi:hypothetical protein
MYRIRCDRILLPITMIEMNVLPEVEALVYIIKTIRRLIMTIAFRMDRIRHDDKYMYNCSFKDSRQQQHRSICMLSK